MKDKIKSLIVISLILSIAAGLFFGGRTLADRYQNTISETYNKYYTKYYDKVVGYIDTAYDEIKEKVRIASNKDKNNPNSK